MNRVNETDCCHPDTLTQLIEVKIKMGSKMLIHFRTLPNLAISFSSDAVSLLGL